MSPTPTQADNARHLLDQIAAIPTWRESLGVTEAFIAAVRERLSDRGAGRSPAWIEEGPRAALPRDGRRILKALFIDRERFLDDNCGGKAEVPLETHAARLFVPPPLNSKPAVTPPPGGK